MLYDVQDLILMQLCKWNLFPTCCDVHVLPEYFLCLEVWGGVLPLGGEPTVKTTCAGLLEPGARPPPPPGGTGGQKRSMIEGKGGWWTTLKIRLYITDQFHLYHIIFSCRILLTHWCLESQILEKVGSSKNIKSQQSVAKSVAVSVVTVVCCIIWPF